jgi:hypothetical protein
VAVGEVEVPLRAGSVEQWWERTSGLASLREPAARALRERVRDAAASYATSRGLVFPGVSRIAFSRS